MAVIVVGKVNNNLSFAFGGLTDLHFRPQSRLQLLLERPQLAPPASARMLDRTRLTILIDHRKPARLWLI